MHASREEMADLRKAIYPLTRKLAVRLARKRRHGRKGPLDFRNTVRHSLSYGGVPAEPKFRYPRPSKPEIFVDRRHLRVGGGVRPVHAAPRLRHQQPVLEGAVLRVHRRHRRGHPLLRGRRGHRRGRPPGQHRGRRGLGRRPLRLRPRLRGVLEQRYGKDVGPEDHGADPGRRPEQLPRLPVVGGQGDAAQGPPRLLAQPRAPVATGTPATRSSASTASHCDGVFECRNLRQLERFVEKLA